MKRFFYFSIALCALILLSPIVLINALIVCNKLGSPVLFKLSRPGRYVKSFIMLKFRSMLDVSDYNGNVLPDSDRLASFGETLRSSSSDELSGLWNVLTGDMSLVGPRPLLIDYLPLYSEDQTRRYNVRPDITC